MSDLSVWNVLLAVSVGYLFGSFPTGVIVARLLGGEDPRRVGSGHTGGSNMLRTAGRLPALITGAIDVLKGPLAVWLVLQTVPNLWLIPLSGIAAVAGHCWPVLASFRGGMGIATAGGLAAWFFPLALPITALFYFLIQRLMRHQARSMMIAAALIPFILLTQRVDAPRLALGVGISLLLILRFAGDFYRVYETRS